MEENDQLKEDMPEATPPINERSTLTISLVIALIGGLITFTWWARGLQSDVRTMQLDLAGIKLSVANLSRVESLQTELREVKQYGSDISRKLALDFIDMKRDFELFKVQHQNKTP